MATTTRVLDANVNGTVYTSNANSALEALDTCHSGATAPTNEVANGKLWLDTSTTPGILKIYNNATWEVVVNTTNVTTSGALMDSELTSIASVKALNQGVSTTDSPSFAGITSTGAFTSLGIDDNAAATAMTLDASGNVGIGTAAPTALLHLSSSAVSGTDVYLSKIDTFGGGFFGTQCSNLAGSQPDWSIVTGSNEPLLFKQSTTERMRIDSSGNLLVGTTTALASNENSNQGVNLGGSGAAVFARTSGSANLYVAKIGTSGEMVRFVANGADVGSIDTTASATSYSTSSDYRLKENIAPVQGAADIVKAMRPCTYTFKSDGSWHDGFLAHELQELHPRAVTGEKDAMKDEEYEVTPAVLDDDGNVVTEAVMGTRSVPDYQGVDYSKLTPILTAALQEALNKIDALEARVAALEL